MVFSQSPLLGIYVGLTGSRLIYALRVVNKARHIYKAYNVWV